MIAFFGGSFDPIHLGHLNVIAYLLKRDDIDEVWVCPAALNPLKQAVASSQMRLAMVEMAIEGMSNVKVCDLEIKRAGPSYTIDTLDQISEEVRLVMSDDLVGQFSQWKEYERLIAQYRPILIHRAGVKEARLDGCEPFLIPLMDISSTEIRQRLKKSLSCDGLLSKNVLNFIRENKLYT